MDPNETMVNEENLDEGLDEDFLSNIEEEDESNEVSPESFTSDSEEEEKADETADEQTQKGTQGTREPGYVKKRVNEAVQRALAESKESMRAEIRAEMQAEFDQRMAPILKKMEEDEAQELVRSRKVSDIETARELVRLRHGQPAVQPEAEKPAESTQQPRNAQGQFAPKEDPVVQARVNILGNQAEKIKAKTGLDVMAEFERNAEIKRKVLSGEIDFYEVAEMMKQPKKRPPAPMRSPNGASNEGRNRIDNMSDAEFRRMEKAISEGKRVTLK